MKHMFALVLVPAVLLGGCGGPRQATVEAAIERAWMNDPWEMGMKVDLISKDSQSGAARGAASTIRMATDAVQKYGGEEAGGISKDVIGGAASLAEKFAGKTDLGNSIARATARDWDVRNLEVQDERASGEDYVVRVRYDLFATIGGERQEVGRDLTETARLALVNNQWEIIQ
jgi:hypothetical protein